LNSVFISHAKYFIWGKRGLPWVSSAVFDLWKDSLGLISNYSGMMIKKKEKIISTFLLTQGYFSNQDSSQFHFPVENFFLHRH